MNSKNKLLKATSSFMFAIMLASCSGGTSSKVSSNSNTKNSPTLNQSNYCRNYNPNSIAYTQCLYNLSNLIAYRNGARLSDEQKLELQKKINSIGETTRLSNFCYLSYSQYDPTLRRCVE